MDRIAIKSLGLISRLGNCEAQVLANFENKTYLVDKQLEFKNVLNGQKARRMNRIAKMFTTTISECIDNCGGDIVPEETGLIANIAYGPINTVMDFGEAVCTEMPELASPTDFANTVNNGIVGHASIYFGLQGPSALLMGSNSVLYTVNLLKKKAADGIFACGVEEYCETVFDYAAEKYNGSLFSEGAASILLSGRGKSDYGYIYGAAESGLGCSPLFTTCKNETDSFEKLIKKALHSAQMEAGDIDCVFFASDKYIGMRESEEEAVNSIFGTTAQKVYIKDMLGETLGSAMTLAIAVAAIAVRAGKYKKVLVSNIEVTGTLEAFVLGKDYSISTYDRHLNILTFLPLAE